MFRIRQSYREDVDQVLAVAQHLDTVNLPADRAAIEAILDRSERSFGLELPVAEREFLFVLEDLAAQRIIGTSIIYAQHGTKHAPHIFYRVENDERYSTTLKRHFVHPTLRIGFTYDGPTEIGGLVLLPEYRRSPPGLGKALSFVRFLYIRMHRAWFRDQVLSELLPPLERGVSRLWEAVGRKLTGLTYDEADRMSKDTKEFIQALFPGDPIHTSLLPDDVRAIIGQVGPETKPVEAMLRRIGFVYANQVDPFDGGPHYTAPTDAITLVRDAREVTVAAVDAVDGDRPWAVLAVELPGARPEFRAIGARVIPLGADAIGLTDDARRRLGVEHGQRLWMCFG
jgi:arginine N-succinyltransferase